MKSFLILVLVLASFESAWATVVPAPAWPRLDLRKTATDSVEFRFSTGPDDVEILGGREFNLHELEFFARINPRLLSKRLPSVRAKEGRDLGMSLVVGGSVLVFVLSQDFQHVRLEFADLMFESILLPMAFLLAWFESPIDSAALVAQKTLALALQTGEQGAPLPEFVNNLRLVLTSIADGRYASCLADLSR